jgi:hypothetical protein
MESGCLAVSFCIVIMHLEMSLVRVLIPYAPVVGVMSFLSPGAPAVFLREGYAGACRVLLVLPITSFLPSVRGLEFPLFDRGTGALLQS